ncbi:hypothetical protein [Agrobacterium tumefaciens]|uniref:hypothetical protein n=1 Tax=Agrobacterium tumefaciens TaxID=358 RepID=UPI002FD90C2E
MPFFRKKPVVIEAIQVRATDFNGETFDGCPFSETPEWLKSALDTKEISIHLEDRDYALWRVNTLEDGPNGEAKHIAEPGDWIIKGVAGELYPCKPDIFEATYDVVVYSGDTDPAPAALAEHSWFSKAALDVTAERRRQIEAEGWGNVHDDSHTNFELTKAAISYAQAAAISEKDRTREFANKNVPSRWPWSKVWWKPKDRRTDLVRAAALLIAEIERLDRAEAKS